MNLRELINKLQEIEYHSGGNIPVSLEVWTGRPDYAINRYEPEFEVSTNEYWSEEQQALLTESIFILLKS